MRISASQILFGFCCAWDLMSEFAGDHHIFTKKNVDDIVNLQPKDSMPKPYQVKQVRNVILKYKLGVGEDE